MFNDDVANINIAQTSKTMKEFWDISFTVGDSDVPQSDVETINKLDTSTGVFSTHDDHCRLPDSLMKALLHSSITFKHSISQVCEHH